MTSPRIHVPERDVSFVEVDGLRFGYLAWEPSRGEDAPLVLLVHGFPDTARSWSTIGPELARAGYRVVAPFTRGYAPTGLPERDTDVERMGRDLLGLVDALGAERARLVGHDWGAEAVYAAASLAPERLERIVTIGIPHRSALRVTPRALWAIRHFLTLQLPGAEARFAADDYAMVEMLYRRWSPAWTPAPEELEPVKNAFAAPGCLHAALGYYRASSLRTPALFRRKLEVPTLSVGGTGDPLLGEADFVRTGEHCTAGFRVAMIGGGHFCHRESERAFLDALVPFLA